MILVLTVPDVYFLQRCLIPGLVSTYTHEASFDLVIEGGRPITCTGDLVRPEVLPDIVDMLSLICGSSDFGAASVPQKSTC